MRQQIVLAAALMAMSACASAPGGSPIPQPSSSTLPAETAPSGWSVSAREHVDLWLHGFAMLSRDTTRVPIFERGYRERLHAIKQRQNAFTNLDANQDKLATAIAADPKLLDAQFLPMYFTSFPEIVQATTLFVQTGGNGSASDQQMQRDIQILGQTFTTPAERDFLRLFVQSLQDESNRFYHAYWTSEQQRRIAGYNAVEQRWRSTMYQKFRTFLGHSQQSRGEILLSLPLGGEGRTAATPDGGSVSAVDYPETAASADAAFYVLAHEVVARVTDLAITDNITPAEQRQGLTTRYSPIGTVRGGAILLQHIAPELVQGYMRYYLAAAGAATSATDLTGEFTSTFALPQPIVDAMEKQIAGVLGGI